MTLAHCFIQSILLALVEKSQNVDLFNDEGNTALILACSRFHSMEVLMAIINKSRFVNHQNQSQVSAAVAMICSGRCIGEIEIILKALLLKGGDPNQRKVKRIIIGYL